MRFRRQALDAAIDRALAQRRIVGAVVLVSVSGETVYARAAGDADREAGRPMTIDTPFRLASLTKPLVTAAALRLVETGRLDLEAAVTDWLPRFRPALPDGDRPVIRLRQLLTHTAGLTYGFLEPPGHPMHEAGVSDGMDETRPTLEENLDRLASIPLARRPGSVWRYSVAMDVLGAVMQVAAGRSLPDIVREEVLAPLGLRDTGFLAADPARLAVPYADAQPVPRRMAEGERVPYAGGMLRFSPARASDPRAFPSGGAGMVGTAPEFLRFLRAIEDGGGSILAPQTVGAMLTNQIGALAMEGRDPGWRFGYGASLLVDPRAAATPQSPGTWQWGGVYGHGWFLDPARRVIVVGLTNTAVEGLAGRTRNDIRDAVYAGLVD